MRIKKTSQTTTMSAQVVNTYSDSTEDTYSCDYVNDLVKVSTFTKEIGIIESYGEIVDTITITIPTGYTAIGVVGFGLSGSNYTRIFFNKLELNASNNSQVYYGVRNATGDATASLTLEVNILFVKTS